MNNQDILRSRGSRLDLRLDNSENNDYELSHDNYDYNASVIDFNNEITYGSLKINETLSGCTNVRDTVTLTEYNAPISGYTYSNLSFIFQYDEFVNYFSTTGFTYSDLILNNDVFTYEGIVDEIHYFYISNFNESVTGTTITDFSTTILPGKCVFTEDCCVQDPILGVKPWSYQINHGLGDIEPKYCDYIIDRRPEKGWTIDLVFNKGLLPWSDGGVFYYLGVKGETDPSLYGDNNLSFKFSDDGRIIWNVIHYVTNPTYVTTTTMVPNYTLGYLRYETVVTTTCTDPGEFIISSGSTDVLSSICTTDDFNITIVFDRDLRLTDCSIPNVGGWNDLIVDETITNPWEVVELQESPNEVFTERLNVKWDEERYGRLGTLKIYLNGRPIYKLKNWEEVIPSTRGFQPFIQQWGGGVEGYNDIHNGDCNFNILGIKYFDEPMDFVHVYHHHITSIKPNYNISCPGIDLCNY